MEKELFRLVVLPVLMYIGLRVFMYMYSEDNNYVIKRLVFIIILSNHPLAHTSHPFNSEYVLL